jgi:hypothetical protein
MMMNTVKILSAAVVVALLGACSESAPETTPVTLNLTLSSPNTLDPTGTVHLYTYNAYRGEGVLRHPLAAIEEKLTYDYGDGQISHGFDYVPGSGEGFAVYAFLDSDGDGALCTPTKRDEFSGFAVLDDEPVGEIDIAIEMSSACAGSERFYPPPM